MPLLNGKPFKRLPPPDGLETTEEVFYLKRTKEAFRQYEDYSNRLLLLKSTVWTCAVSFRPNLTFSEACKSEKRARERLQSLSTELKAPIMVIANATKCSRIREMVESVFQYMRVRIFKKEICIALQKTLEGRKTQHEVEVLAIAEHKTNSDQFKYRVKTVNGSNTTEPFIVSSQEIRRKTMLSRKTLKLYLKQYVVADETGQLKIKDEIYKKVVTDAGVKSYADVFPGPLPQFKMSKGLAMKFNTVAASNQQDKLNATDGKHSFPLSNEQQPFAKRMEELRLKAKSETFKAEETKRTPIEMHRMTMSTFHSFNQLKDDLELRDQKRIAPFKPIRNLIPTNHFGDALMVLEFMHSVADQLDYKGKFPNGYNFELLERSLLCREVAGPLSDIIEVLMATLFNLQMDEANDVEISYVNEQSIETSEPVAMAAIEATKAANWTTTHLQMKINALPMNSMTISEVLRLHLLMSGASVNKVATKWRLQHRGGYGNRDDPGLMLRLEKPHILRALSHHSVYELPLGDIISILKCLVDQILTYASIRETVEDRREKSAKVRAELKALYSNERKNKTNFQAAKKRLLDHTKKCVAEASVQMVDNITKYKDDMNRKLEEDMKMLVDDYEREKNEIEKSIESLKRDVFRLQESLGSDRAYRMYWLFGSLPGLFIEHQPFGGKCFENAVTNIHELANCSSSDRYSVVKTMMSNQNHGDQKIETNASVPVNPDGNIKNEPAWSQADLLMCTGDASTCPVHAKYDRNRVNWSFLHTEEELNALIESLNPKGFREKALRDTLESEKELILNHIKHCPFNQLQIDSATRVTSYDNVNIKFPKGTEIPHIIETNLVQAILELEMNVQTGQLGSIKVNDRLAWRNSLQNFEYDQQCDGEDKKSMNDSGTEVDSPEKIVVDDLSSSLGNTPDIESNFSGDDWISLHPSMQNQLKVHGYASALQQIAQGIRPEFLKPPFGYLKLLKNKRQQETILKSGRENLKMWCVTLMNATSLSQVFLHYNILNKSIKWPKSTPHATCTVCKIGSENGKMVLCDGCNAGQHLCCFEPKLTKVPEDDWLCEECKRSEKKVVRKTRATSKRDVVMDHSEDSQLSSSESDEDAEDEEDGHFYRPLTPSDEDDVGTCTTCHKPGRVLQKCDTCYREVHLNCARPKLLVRCKKWYCHICKAKPDFKLLKKETARNKLKRRSTRQRIVPASLIDSDDSDDMIPIKKRRLAENEESPKTSSDFNPTDSESEESSSITSGSDENDESVGKHVPRSKQNKNESDNGTNRVRRNLRRKFDDQSTGSSSTRRSSRRIEENVTTNAKRSRRPGNDRLSQNVSLHGLLNDIKNHNDSWPFMRPVKNGKVSDRKKTIQRPMDFGKITSKWISGTYSSINDVMADIQLVFTNCHLHYDRGSEIYQSGVYLEKFVQKRCVDLGLPFSHSDMITDARPKRNLRK